MWKAALAGALALAMGGSSFALAEGGNERIAARYQTASADHATASLADSRIYRFKAALRLTPDQERHWPAVETVLRDLVRRYEASRTGGMLQHVSERAASAVMGSSAVNRLVAAATPLVRSLSPDQKRDALQLARAMGFAEVAARFE
jgi:zinc resistance-associated protein